MFNKAILSRISIGKSPFHMAKKRAFDEGFRQRCTINYHKIFIGPTTVFMNGPGKKFLAGSCGTSHQNTHIRGGRPGNLVQTFLNSRTAAYYFVPLQGNRYCR